VSREVCEVKRGEVTEPLKETREGREFVLQIARENRMLLVIEELDDTLPTLIR